MLANTLSLIRVPLGVAFWVMYDRAAVAIAIVVAAAISDALDGRVARWSRRRAGLDVSAPSAGDWLDPLADKAFVVLALAAIGAHDRAAWPAIALIVAREVLLVPVMVAYALRRGPAVRLRARPIGKLATVAQFVAAVLLAAGEAAAWPVAIATAAIGIAAVIDQVVANRASS